MTALEFAQKIFKYLGFVETKITTLDSFTISEYVLEDFVGRIRTNNLQQIFATICANKNNGILKLDYFCSNLFTKGRETTDQEFAEFQEKVCEDAAKEFWEKWQHAFHA